LAITLSSDQRITDAEIFWVASSGAFLKPSRRLRPSRASATAFWRCAAVSGVSSRSRRACSAPLKYWVDVADCGDRRTQSSAKRSAQTLNAASGLLALACATGAGAAAAGKATPASMAGTNRAAMMARVLRWRVNGMSWASL